VLGWAIRHVGNYKWRLIALAALSCVEVGLRVILPWPMKAVVDNALGSAPPAAWLTIAGASRERLLLVAVVAGLVIQVAHQIVLMTHTRVHSHTGHLITRDVRERLFGHLQALNLRHHTETPIGDSVYRLEADAGSLEHLLLRGVLPLTFSALTLVVMFGILTTINIWLALVSLSVVPFMFAWIRWSARYIRPGAERTKQAESRLTARLHESFAAIRLVKSFAREPYEGQRFSGAVNEAMRARVTLSRREAIYSLVVGNLTVIGSSAVILVGGLLVLDQELSVGTLLIALAYLGFVYGPLAGIANTTGTVQQAIAGARRVRETLELSPETDDRGAIQPIRFAGRIEFDRVSFAYDGRPVLTDISFSAEPGEFVALVGPSGSGKTTLISLIPRFYMPAAGRVLIDGVDVTNYRLSALREQVSVVLQEAVILSGSVRANLRYGRLEATDEEIERAARAANAHEFIEGLENGYDTELGEAGAGLSGGQKQRLSMARAFLKDAPILILDEPTAALDTISEQLVFSAVRRLRHGRTTIVIAHRLSTVRQADRILVMDRGRVVAEGTHDALVATSPLYQRLAAQLTETPANQT
jgi:ATP-binding cassette, subfamily B, bacterial